MALRDEPEWLKKGGDGDPLEADIRKQLDEISSAVAGTCDKKFTVAKEGERLLVSMKRADSTEALFTVSPVDGDEYLLMDAGAGPRDLPIFVGPRDEMLERMKNELLHTYLESWEREAVTGPEETAADEPESVDTRPANAPGLRAEDWEMLNRLINPDPDKPKPPELN
jgi:hypothetical protein